MHAIVKERPQLSKEELERRRDAVDFARVNVELEGLPTNDAFREVEERYARGEIDLDEVGRYVDALIEERVNAIHRKRVA